MKLKDISRTATFAWDQSSSSSPLIVTGAVAGALDATFSNDSQLEIWQPDFGENGPVRLGGEGKGPLGSISVTSRFNKLAWSQPFGNYSRGLIAAGMETGEVHVYDPEKILAGASADAARIFSNDKHNGPVRGLDWNASQKNLLLTGGTGGELYIFDLNNLAGAPIPPGPVSSKLKDITAVQWNHAVPHVFAASSSSGYTSVWDSRKKQEMTSLRHGNGVSMSDVCWHPDDPLRLITASDADDQPVIMVWNVRNTRAPERVLTGHSKGVLSVSWCKQDSDLLLSCGKDNRTLCWNPQTGDIVAELAPSNDWSFQTAWCSRNPDLIATASYDGHIGVHSLQTTQTPEPAAPKFSEDATADDVFGSLGDQETVDDVGAVLSLQQPPRWLRRPVSATFGFNGLLASTSNLPGPSGKHQSGVVHLRTIVTEQSVVDLVDGLSAAAGDKEKLEQLCGKRADEQSSDAAWKTLQTLFKANSRQEIIQLLGFSKDEVEQQVADAVKKFGGLTIDLNGDSPTTPTIPKANILANGGEESADGELTPPASIKSEAGASEASEVAINKSTEPSLFDDQAPGTPASAAADFFSSMASGTLRNPLLDHVIPHKTTIAESAAATVGSRASSVRSETMKENTFRIHPSGEGDIDRLVTQALVIGDFQSAVNLCLAADRFADALLLAVRGGPDLLQSTQKAYFAKRTATTPFLRIFQSIVTEDLVDIVQNADVTEWKAIFVVICTFAKDSDFANLADQLGQRLQYRWQVFATSDSPEAKSSARVAREDATLCFLAARRLEKVITIWIDEMREDEESSDGTRYSAHAAALQSFIEKVAVFVAATGYVDEDLLAPTESAAAAEAGARTYKLAALYDRYYEYADLLANQGLVDVAAKYVQMTPIDYKGSGSIGDLDKAKDRIVRAAGVSAAATPASTVFSSSAKQVPAPSSAYTPVTPARATAPTAYASATQVTTASPYAAAPTSYAPPSSAPGSQAYQSQQAPSAYQPVSQAYAPSEPTAYAPQGYQPPSSYGSNNPYAPEPQAQGYGAPTGGIYQPAAPAQPLGPPPRAGGSISGPSSNSTPPPVPAAQRRDIPGWNDAPSLNAPPKRPQSASKDLGRPAPIMSPFPMSQDPMQGASPLQPALSSTLSPPPRAQQPGVLPPPPKGGPRPPSAHALAKAAMTPQQTGPPPVKTSPQSQQQAQMPPQSRPPPPQTRSAGPPPPGRGGPPPGTLAGPPPRALSPLGPQGRVASPLSQQIIPPPQQQPLQSLVAPPAHTRPDGLSQGAPPSGAGSRIGGPPPPGRTPSAAGHPVSAQPIPPTSPAAPPGPTKPTYPRGDRSHISPEAKPVYDILSTELGRVKQLKLDAPIKRIADDTERRLNLLFDGLNNDNVPKAAVDQMQGIAKALAARDMNGALAMHVDLMTNATGDVTVWATGVRQLIRLSMAA